MVASPDAFRDGPGEFSSKLYWQHREYNAVLGSAAVLAVLVARLVWNSH